MPPMRMKFLLMQPDFVNQTVCKHGETSPSRKGKKPRTLLTSRRSRGKVDSQMSTDYKTLIERAAAELKVAGAREVYVFGSAVKGAEGPASDLDLAVSGLTSVLG
ncbi:MAG: nucleotidyltransferase domain-containing protein [Pedosphaera sp.]|nr:nucleotidyltransferase domain-containing protein [Pedosphaera sp.]